MSDGGYLQCSVSCLSFTYTGNSFVKFGTLLNVRKQYFQFYQFSVLPSFLPAAANVLITEQFGEYKGCRHISVFIAFLPQVSSSRNILLFSLNLLYENELKGVSQHVYTGSMSNLCKHYLAMTTQL